jgi:hypothetical protein
MEGGREEVDEWREERRRLTNGGRKGGRRRGVNEEETKVDCRSRMCQGVEGDLRVKIEWIGENNQRKEAR